MARQPRVDFPGAVHHIYGRGNGRQPIFRDDEDRRSFLRRLFKYKSEAGVSVLAYCLMANHYHLLALSGERPIGACMQKFLTSYTRIFNDRWNTVGHLFQGRFNSRRCKTDIEVRAAARYIHLNPVEANLVAEPALWAWSGHRGLLGEHDPLLDSRAALAFFGGETDGKSEYLRFLATPPAQTERPDISGIAAARWSPAELELMRSRSQLPDASRLRRDFIVAALAEGHRRSEVAAFLGRSLASISYLHRGGLKIEA